MLVQESYTNESEGYQLGHSDHYEPFTDKIGDLFLAYQRQYGRCISKVYIDKGNESKAIGWVFEHRVKYDDCNQYYIQHTWITLHNSQPIKSIEYDYKFIG